MDLNKLNELDIHNIGEWPLVAKAAIIAMLCAALGYGWYHFITSKQLDRLADARTQELQLRQSFEVKQEKSANLEAYRQQLIEIEESFGTMLRQLPDRTEVAALLVDVSQTGLAAGLEFELFQPAAEVNKDFYAELPITMRVTGKYHEFGRFISGLAALPRIVTIHNVGISPGSGGTETGTAQLLRMEATVKTYRYLDEAAVR